MMKKLLLTLAIFFLAFQLQAQTQAPPVHDVEQEEPTDLAIESAKPQPAPKKKTPTQQPTSETPTTEKMRVAPEKTIELPSQPALSPPPTSLPTPPPVKPMPPPPEPVKPEPPKPEIKVPSNVPVVPVETPPAQPLAVQPPAPGEITPPPTSSANVDGGPMKDAGSDLITSLPITYALYDDNSLSPTDMIDVYKFYGRAKEGVSVVLTPKHPSSQLVCEIVNEAGELLSETKAPSPGTPLSFQTSPLDQNSTLYFRVKDLNLLPDSPPTEIRKYSLELKPIQALVVTQPMAATAQENPTAEKKKPGPTKKEALPSEVDWVLYGSIGAGALLVLLITMIVFRKLRQKKGHRPKEGA